MASPSVSLEEVSHLALNFGRILFQSNADTEEVQESVRRFAAAFGCEAKMLLTYETLLLTISLQGEFRTKAGNRVPAMGVNMATVAAAKSLLTEIEGGLKDLGVIRSRLLTIETQPPIYAEWVVVLGLSLTAASLSRLFGGDWSTFSVAFGAAVIGTWLRLKMGKRGWNLFLVAFLTAAVSGAMAGRWRGLACCFIGVSNQPFVFLRRE